MARNITIQKILSILLRRLPMIILSGVLVGLLFFIYTSVAIAPVYKTSSMIYIQNYGKDEQNMSDDYQDASPIANPAAGMLSSESYQSNNDVAQKIFNSDLTGSAALAENCVTLFQNSTEITRYYDGCSVEMEVADKTFYITISVSGTDPQLCANVANIVAEKCNTVFHSHFPYGKIGTIREAYTPSSPVSPNKVQNTMIGAAVGIIIACVIAILLEMVDTTIKGDDDLAAMYKIPVFAEIPDFEQHG